MKRRRLSFVLIVSCFVLGLMDLILTLILLNTGYFRELNPIGVVPYFIIIPLLLFFRKDKYLIYGLFPLTMWLGYVVFHNSVNLSIYMILVI